MGGLSCQPKRPDKEVQIMEKQYKYLHWGSNTQMRSDKILETEIDEDRPKWGSQLGDSGPKKTPHSQFGDSPAEIKKNKKKYFDWQKKKQKKEEGVGVDKPNL